MLSQLLPHWLVQPGPVLLRRFIKNKNQPRVDTVELIEANPNFAHTRFPDGRESTVSVSDLAPSQSPQPVSEADNDSMPEAAEPKNYINQKKCHENIEQLQIRPNCSDNRSKHLETEIERAPPTLTFRNQSQLRTEPLVPNNNSGVELRRSSRTSKPPERYGQNIYDQ